jgi:hypothetical protein
LIDQEKSETGSVSEMKKQCSFSIFTNTFFSARTGQMGRVQVSTFKKRLEKNSKISTEFHSDQRTVLQYFYFFRHYLKSIGIVLSMATIFLNMVFQGFSIGSNIWLSMWSIDPRAGNETGVRDMYLGVYGAFGAGQGKNSEIHIFFLQNNKKSLTNTNHTKIQSHFHSISIHGKIFTFSSLDVRCCKCTFHKCSGRSLSSLLLRHINFQ